MSTSLTTRSARKYSHNWSTFSRCSDLCRYYSTPPSDTSRSTISSIPPPRLDYRAISENVTTRATNALNRNAPVRDDLMQSISRTYKEHKTLLNDVNAKRNLRSVIGQEIQRCAKEKDVVGKQKALEEAKGIKEIISGMEARLVDLEEQLLVDGLTVPNDTHPDTPLGPEDAAVTLATHGAEPLPASPNRDHLNICRKLGLIDLDSAAVVTGSSWYYLLNEAALLEMALTNYALSVAIKHGFKPVTTPDVVRLGVAARCGFQPRDHTADPPASQFYHIANVNVDHSSSSANELVLSGTAEIPLAGLFANKISAPSTLPLKVVGIGKAFRSEAGARGADTRGLYRVHQFSKVELFAVTTQEASESMMEEIRTVQESILNGLGLTYRVLDMPTQELGASAYRKYDMEAWMPGRGKWGEVSSLSNCTDYQARRLHIRYRLPEKPSSDSVAAPLPFAHTLNGTAAAIPRLIIALLENGAVFDETGELKGVELPEVLRPFWVGGESKHILRWR
ncbi:seryl-tRNA synthetase [Pterulicium gracile]|uniref:serine--tRNA ligase n=1 Tax=Pterulicium gracile TaxID=1884261 RepID=A0A5C3QGZ8_9AGAR|nr:seryl-tRNA synthetase [Pterula gracilis]